MHDLIDRLKDGELDVIVGDFDAVKLPEGFHMQHAWTPEFRAFATASRPLAQGKAAFAQDLVKFP